MGGSVSRILSGLLWTKKEIRILILGLVCYVGPACDAFPWLKSRRTMLERRLCSIG